MKKKSKHQQGKLKSNKIREKLASISEVMTLSPNADE